MPILKGFSVSLLEKNNRIAKIEEDANCQIKWVLHWSKVIKLL